MLVRLGPHGRFQRELAMADRKWRRTDLRGADGHHVRDDWCLIDEKLGPIARIYRLTGGPQDGQWFWAVQIDAHGRPWNSGSGSEAIGAEAKAAVEAIVAGF
jgi:hypothetical protein